MKMKEAIRRLTMTFEYDKFKFRWAEDPKNITELTKAINALFTKQTEILKPAIFAIINDNWPKGKPVTPEKLKSDGKRLDLVEEAIIRWRKELMPDWHEVAMKLEKRIVEKNEKSIDRGHS